MSEPLDHRDSSPQKPNREPDEIRKILDNANAAILIAQDGRLVYFNSPVLEIIGYAEAELNQMGFRELIHPEDRNLVTDQDFPVPNGEQVRYSHTLRFISKSGDTHWARVNASLIDWNGKPASMNFLTDVTERYRHEDAVAKTEIRFLEIVEQAVDVIYTTDERGFFTYVNPAAEELTGYSVRELIGKHFTDLIPLEWQERIKGFYEKHYRDRIEETVLRFPFKRKDGTDRWVEQTVRLLVSDGEVTGFQSILRDITRRMELERTLEESENRYRSLVEMSPLAFAVHKAGKLVYINQAGVGLLAGSSSEEILEKSLMDFIHPDYQQVVLERVQMGYDDREPAGTMEEKFIRMDGKIIDVEVASEPITYEGEQATQVIIRDISATKQARDALQVYADRLKIMHQLDQAILAAGSPKEIALAVSQRVRQMVPCQRVSVTLFDIDSNQATIIAADISQSQEIIFEQRFPLDEGFLDYFKNQKIRVVDDIQALSNKLAMESKLLEQGIRSYMNIPLVVHGELVGTLNLGSRLAHTFTNEHIEIAQEMSDPLAVAIQQARLYEVVNKHAEALENRVSALGESERYLAMLNEITHAANGVQEFNELMQVLADRLGELFGADGCYIALWDEENNQVIPTAAYGPLKGAYPLLPKEGREVTITKSVLEAEKPIYAQDIHNSNLISPKVAARFPHQAMLGIPLIAADHKLGAVVIAYDHPEAFKTEMIARGEQTGGQIALAIAKAQLLESERRRRKEAETLRTVTNALASTLELDQVLEIILDQLAVVISYDSASIMLWESDKVKAVAAHGFVNPSNVIGQLYPANNPLFDEIRRTGKALWLSNPIEDPRFGGWGGTEMIRSWMALPLFARGKFIGFMTLDSYEPHAYAAPQEALVQPYANQAAQAIENARLFDWVQKQAVTDALTGLFNRRGLFELGQREVERAHRFERPLVAIMLDIDLFKQVNDKYGHYIGDQVLLEIGNRCGRALRKVDLLGRYGGEEFAVLLPETEMPVGLQIAERLRRNIADEPFLTDRGTLGITISLGVTAMRDDMADLTEFLDAADSAMYAAKQAGRNCVRELPPPGQ